MANFSLDPDRWNRLTNYARAYLTAWWREKNLRDSLSAKAQREVGKLMSKNEGKPNTAGKSPFSKWFGR